MTAFWRLGPNEIEAKSFAIIDQEAGRHSWPPDEWTLIRRLIHASADFDYLKDTVMSPLALQAGIAAIKAGATIVTDTRMALSGINRRNLAPFANELVCLIDHPKTMELAQAKASTRAQAAVDTAFAVLPKPSQVIWVFGNAPTALFRLLELLEEPTRPKPLLILGWPVGFVNALEAKRELSQKAPAPFICNISRKGGSNIAAASVNALARLAHGQAASDF
ncbi:MAG: precorrin-8X methylmutase [Deltaproteobacteria bacterium]|jgi:precorrin-8X/cobalt-precorrin-8 methylmutase|nr:precorrin-8X methylmutase [Deltaproteobacteria bacterium]